MERFVPIQIKKCTVEPLNKVLQDTRFYNIVVDNCPPFIPLNDKHWIRQWPIVRFVDESVEWPPHPRNDKGDLLGAVVLIKSIDNHYLLVRNNNLWGLPKGTRNYVEYTELLENRDDDTFCFDEVTLKTVESPQSNAIREVKEETGIQIDPDKLKCINERNPHGYVRFFYQVPFKSTDYGEIIEKMIDSMDHENDEVGWFTTDQIQDLLQKHTSKSSFTNRKLNYVSWSFLKRFVPNQPPTDVPLL